MTFRLPAKTFLLGMLQLVAIGATVAGCYWLVRWGWPKSEVRGSLVLLLAFSPLAAGYLARAFWRGARRMWRATCRYGIDPDQLLIRSPLGRQSIAWSDVVDFGLPPALFPKPPDRLQLVTRAGRTLALPLALEPKEQFRERLISCFAPLHANGLERTRIPKRRVPSVWKLRWLGVRTYAVGAYIGLFFLLLGLLAVVGAGLDLSNYFRLRAHHHRTFGTVVAIEIGKDTRDAEVRFSPNGTHTVQVGRTVMSGFELHYPVGSSVPVDYLPSNPSVARIPSWDMDGRQWVLLLFLAPFIWIGASVLNKTLRQLLTPHVQFAWAPARAKEGFALKLSRAGLETLVAFLPERHQGAMLVTALRPVDQNRGTPPLSRWALRLRRAGIDARRTKREFLALDADACTTMLQRLGPVDTMRAQYFVLGSPDADAAVRFATGQLPAAAIDPLQPPLPECRLLFSRTQDAGPFTANELPELMQRWFKLHLSRLFNNSPPPGLVQQDFVRMLSMDPTQSYRLLARCLGGRVQLWAHDDAAGDARVAEFDRGQWAVFANRPIPRLLRKDKKRLFWLLAGPFVLLHLVALGIVLLVFWPFLRLRARGYRTRIWPPNQGSGSARECSSSPNVTSRSTR